MQYSPKLKKVMEEIKEILKREDIAGVVILHTPGYSEYLNHLTTSYTCVIETTKGIEFRLKTEEVGTKEAMRLAAGTYDMITHITDVIMPQALNFGDTQKLLKSKWGGEEDSGEHSSHQQQNN